MFPTFPLQNLYYFFFNLYYFELQLTMNEISFPPQSYQHVGKSVLRVFSFNGQTRRSEMASQGGLLNVQMSQVVHSILDIKL